MPTAAGDVSPIETAEFALSPDTLYRLLAARTFGGHMRLYLFNGVFVALLIASVLYVTFDLSQGVGLAVLVGLLALVLVALGYPLWRYRQYVNAPSNAHLFAPVRCVIDPQFIAVRHANGQVARTPLRSVSRALLTRSHWLLYVGALAQHVIPLSAFETQADREKFETWLQDARVFIQRTRRG